jgi:uncharacterized protein YndB with AHSA1/START domain
MNKGRVIEEAAIVFERELCAPVEKVWAFLTEPVRLLGWYGEAMIEPKEGGRIELMNAHVQGVITGWRPHQFLAHTWNVFQPNETISAWPVTYLEFMLTAQAQSTNLTLTHRPIPARMQPQTMMGWHTFLEMLECGCRDQKIEPRNLIMQRNAVFYGVDLNNLER